MTIANLLEPVFIDPTQKHVLWGPLHGSSISLALSTLLSSAQHPILILTPDTATASRLKEELSFFLPPNSSTLLEFPDWETLPYDHFSPHQDIISSRLATLFQLPLIKKSAIITPISTLMHQICPPDYLNATVFLLKTGDKLPIEPTRQRLERAGYRTTSEVREHGEFAIRGSIIDLFPMGAKTPFRIDLLDDEIDSIRTFSPDTQRSVDKIEKIELLPAKEFPLTQEGIEHFRQAFRAEFSGNPLNCSLYQDISEGIASPGIEYYLSLFFQKTASLLDYLPAQSQIVMVTDIHSKAEEFWQEIKTRYEQHAHDVKRPILNPQKVFITPDEIFRKMNLFQQIKINTTPFSSRSGEGRANSPPSSALRAPSPLAALREKELTSRETDVQFDTRSLPILSVEHKATRPLHLLEQFLAQHQGRVLFCAETAGRREVLLHLFQSISLFPKQYTDWQSFLSDDATQGIIVGDLEEGLYSNHPNLIIITEMQLFGKRVFQRRLRKTAFQDPDVVIKNLSELQIGAPIVHIDHGIGRYLGLQTLQLGEVTTEFLALEYADQDKLYVPVSSLHLIGRYTGSEHAPLHKLGSGHWQRAKKKAAEQVRDVAAELLALYAKRAAHPGLACQIIDGQYEAFASAFPFEETPDQLRAINDVINDMKSEKPMDRLVCGDVGFGKTEVAMRAAFVAALNNKQVAILVPTTLLAEQHYHNFMDRFADWPIKIGMISRFNTSKETQSIVNQLEEGKIDIVIGTHKLLQGNIQFKALGLVVIDEEHRFGVQQKERLKSLRASVDILTLTATPIPRTLNMAFAGIRDLSIIATPPAKRLSIKTFIQENQSHIIKEAILREILRGGQVYYLHNEVKTIEKTTRELEKLVPEARIHYAHGQMREKELEQVMSDFYHRRFNVLVCSTIIESGIDIPSANTIIIERADQFGIAQLHQLRGRVGRSHHQAYAYLLTPPAQQLTPDALKRLDAIATYGDLGIGFTLATHDLEIRGAGELLGEGQSGSMHEIGFTLYMDLLNRAVDSLKSGKAVELETTLPRTTELDLQLSAFIPDKYLPDVNLRLNYYRRVATAKSSHELDDIQVEMIDRFGLLPETAKAFFAIGELRLHAERLGIKKIDANAKQGKIEFNEHPTVDPMKIIQLIQQQSDRFKLDGPTKLRFTLSTHETKNRVSEIQKVLNLLT